MGYCVDMNKSTISITKENSVKIMSVLRNYIIESHPDWRWVSNKYLIECIEENDFEAMMDEIRYAVVLEKDLYVIDYMSGEKLGNDYEIFKLIAPFVNDGYIEMSGEDDCLWRWVFKDGKCEEVYPKVEW